MTTLDLQVAANADDATGTLSGSQFNASQSAVRMDSSTAGDGSRWLAGFRFQNVAIPQGATIDVAYVTFNLITGSDDANVDMYAEDADDAVDFTAANLISRTLTTATAGWVEANASSPAQSPSIVALIQEVIDRPGWTSGNDLCLIFIGRGDFNGQFRVVAHDGTPASAAQLHIEYTEAGGDIDVPIGQATETAVAQAMTALKMVSTGQASETDLAQPVAAQKTAVIDQATETDLAQGVGIVKVVTIGQAVETDLAQPVTVSSNGVHTVVPVGRATETDAARPMTAVKLVAIGQAIEQDVAQPVSIAGLVVVAAFGAVFRPNRAGRVTRPNRAGAVHRPNRTGAVASDRQGD